MWSIYTLVLNRKRAEKLTGVSSLEGVSAATLTVFACAAVVFSPLKLSREMGFPLVEAAIVVAFSSFAMSRTGTVSGDYQS